MSYDEDGYANRKGSITRTTRASMAAGAPQRWKETYGDIKSPKHQRITERLLALQNPTAEEINQIIGNKSWTTLSCEVCNREVEAVVVFADASSNTINVCSDCLDKAGRIA